MAYRRSIFLINRRFQFRFAFYVCSWLIALSFVYPLIIFQLFDFFLRYMAADPNAPDVTTIVQTRESLLYLLIAMQFILLSVTFLISIFMSHRIAGPLFKLKKYFSEAAQGRLGDRLFFRKSDHFHDIADSFNTMTAGLRDVLSKNAEEISAATAKIEKAVAKADPASRAELESAAASLRHVLQSLPQ
jgi:methyl-accepting chemotaxis protein